MNRNSIKETRHFRLNHTGLAGLTQLKSDFLQMSWMKSDPRGIWAYNDRAISLHNRSVIQSRIDKDRL